MSDLYSTPEGPAEGPAKPNTKEQLKLVAKLVAEEQSKVAAKVAAKGSTTLVHLSNGKPVECTSCYETVQTLRLSYPYGVEVDEPPFGWFWKNASDE